MFPFFVDSVVSVVAVVAYGDCVVVVVVVVVGNDIFTVVLDVVVIGVFVVF